MAEDQENKFINHHGKTATASPITRKRNLQTQFDENDNDSLTLSLGLFPTLPTKQPLISSEQPPQPFVMIPQPPTFMITQPPRQPSRPLPLVYRQDVGSSRQVRSRRNPCQAPAKGKCPTIPPPFPWATDKRATIHTLDHLRGLKIFTIKGDVQCRRCDKTYEMEYDLQQRFYEIGSFICENRASMRDRAPEIWTDPVLPTCKLCCQENIIKPVISEKKRSINWLFLLLGQMLGCCTLEQLKYFCKHTKNHRTGAKDRVLYLAYLSLCKQLDPDGPFNRA